MMGLSQRIPAVLLVWMAMWSGCHGNSDKQTGSPTPAPAPTIKSFDEFNKQLAERVTAVMHATDADFQVGVTTVMDPIGTLYRQGRSYVFNDTSCKPSMDPMARDMPSVFPSYQIDGKLAGDLGLEQAILQGAATADVKYVNTSSFSFSVVNPQLTALSDTSMQDLLADKKCTSVLKNQQLVFVRGYVIGQRRFTVKTDVGGSAKLGVVKAGNFTFDKNASNSMDITDDKPRAFLQILSEVVSPPAAAATVTAKLVKPTAVGGEGKIYIQQDQADNPKNGEAVQTLLKGAGFQAESHIEKTNSTRTPERPQIRYFNEADKDKAKQLLDVFKKQYDNAVLVPLKVPAPQGQLEVWLPRAQPK
jgi:hypothetical protein